MTTPDERITVQEVWKYQGVRRANAGKVFDEWSTEDATSELWYPRKGANARNYGIGDWYTATVEHSEHEDGRTRRTLVGEPVFLRAADPDDESNVELAALHHAAMIRVVQDRAGRRSAQGPDPLTVALKPLVRLANGMRTQADKDALVARVLGQLYGAWR